MAMEDDGNKWLKLRQLFCLHSSPGPKHREEIVHHKNLKHNFRIKQASHENQFSFCHPPPTTTNSSSPSPCPSQKIRMAMCRERKELPNNGFSDCHKKLGISITGLDLHF